MYIGKTEANSCNKRWKQHIADSQNPSRSNYDYPLYRAFRKYGLENFSFEEIEKTEDTCAREAYWIAYCDSFHKGYNQTLGGDGRKVLDLDEQKVIAVYNKLGTVKETAEYFGNDPYTIRILLRKNSIVIENNGSLLQSIQVQQIDPKTNSIIAVYASVTDASKAINKMSGNRPNSHITDVCRGKRKTAYGYKWQYVDNASAGHE